MCGIAGFVSSSASNLEEVITAMTNAIAHRGPDDSGTWIDRESGLAFGHRRLSILDLSIEGHQPMFSKSNRYVIVYNGEVYNFNEIRAVLESSGHGFRGHSDTEVMLAAVEEWGITDAVQRFNGMFAFALWDKQEKILHLGRDRIGIKPLYYGWEGNTFLWGSELKALRAHTAFHKAVSRDSVALMMRFSYVPTPYSIYEGIYKLPPGCLLSVPLEQLHNPSNDFSPHPEESQAALRPVQFWSVRESYESGCQRPFEGTAKEAQQELDRLLRDAVKMRMISDVPLGAFLSGGIDSSLVVALMQAQSTAAVKTFSIGFFEDEYNEAQYATQVAKHLNTDHTELCGVIGLDKAITLIIKPFN